MPIRRNLAIVVAAFTLLTLAGSAIAKDFRTAFIRVVPEQDWKPEKGSSMALEVVNSASHEDAGEFTKALTSELEEQLGRVLGYKIDPAAKTKLKVTLAEFDPGNAGMRLGLGFGGKSYVGGSIEVTQDKKEVGSLLFSFQPNLAGAAAMAREGAAGLALKLSNGDRDKELHPLKKKKK